MGDCSPALPPGVRILRLRVRFLPVCIPLAPGAALRRRLRPALVILLVGVVIDAAYAPGLFHWPTLLPFLCDGRNRYVSM